MARFRAEVARRKANPLIEQGHKTFIPYSNNKAFETRKVEKKYGKYNEKSYTTNLSRMPTSELLSWLDNTAGPRGILWLTEKTEGGFNIYFAVATHAMLFKLTWGGV